MEFRIRHEKITTVVLLISAFVIMCGLIMAFIMMDIPDLYLLLGFLLLLVIIIVFVVFQTKSTVIKIEDRTITINYVFAKKTINIDEISNIEISRYKRWHKNHYIEKRMRMTIGLYDKKSIVLNDTAMAHTEVLGILSDRNSELPDEEVTIYQAYQMIKSQMR